MYTLCTCCVTFILLQIWRSSQFMFFPSFQQQCYSEHKFSVMHNCSAKGSKLDIKWTHTSGDVDVLMCLLVAEILAHLSRQFIVLHVKWPLKLSDIKKIKIPPEFSITFLVSDFIQIYWAILELLHIYRVSQEEWTKFRESVPYVELYRYNPKHLYPKLNGYGDNGQRSLKLWQLLHTYWLPNSY